MSKKVDNLEVKMGQGVFDMIWPVGAVYVQYPQQDDPTTLFNKNGIKSTWSVLNYNGAFFRAQGGSFAAAFIDKNATLKVQEASLPNITGTLKHIITRDEDSTADGAFKVTSHASSKDEGTQWMFDYAAVDINANRCDGAYGRRTNGTLKDVAPENYTIRVWKRTA